MFGGERQQRVVVVGEAVGGPEDAADFAHVFAQDNHPFVGRHFFIQARH